MRLSSALYGSFVIALYLSSPLSYAVEFQKYTKDLQIEDSSETSRKTLLGIIDSCGNTTRLDDACMVEGLERVSKEENNIEARFILNQYNKAISEGNFNKPECQTESHTQANLTIGHCILLFNSYMLENYEKNDAISRYEMCLQGGMMGLAYHGNLAAQYMLSEIYHDKQQDTQGITWTESLKTKKDTEEYDILMKCYGSFLSLG